MRYTTDEAPTTVWLGEDKPRSPVGNLPARTATAAVQNTEAATQHYGPTQLRALLDRNLKELSRHTTPASPTPASPTPGSPLTTQSAPGKHPQVLVAAPAMPQGKTRIATAVARKEPSRRVALVRAVALAMLMPAIGVAAYAITAALYRDPVTGAAVPAVKQATAAAVRVVESPDPSAQEPTAPAPSSIRPQDSSRRDPLRASSDSPRQTRSLERAAAATAEAAPQPSPPTPSQAAEALFAGHNERAMHAYRTLASDPNHGETYALLARLAARRAKKLQNMEEVTQ